MQNEIEKIWNSPELLTEPKYIKIIEEIIEELDTGQKKVVEMQDGTWKVHQWIKQAILLYFRIRKMEKMEAGFLEFYDKMRVKSGFEKLGVRVVPPAIARFGSFLAPGVILMPSYVNIGAYVDSGTMVDTWATVGSCAYIGKNVHLSGGVGIGGVLEPVQASPVIVEDGAFIGSRCILVEGVHVGKEAVLGAGVTITGSTRLIDVTGQEPVYLKGKVPERSVVIPGSYLKEFPSGNFQVPCALIIGKRHSGTDLKTTLNEALREHQISI